MRSWYDLDEDEKNKLETEFKEKSSLKKSKALNNFSVGCGIFLVLFGIFCVTNDGPIILSTIVIICGSIGFLLGMLSPESKEYDKEFSKWLEVSKKIIK